LAKLRVYTAEQRAAINAALSAAITGPLNPFWGRTHNEAALAANTVAHSHGLLYVYDALGQLQFIWPSVKTLANLIQCNHGTIKGFIKSGDLFRGHWYFANEPVLEFSNVAAISSASDPAYAQLLQQMRAAKPIRKKIFVFCSSTKNFIAAFNSLLECSAALQISHTTVTKHANNGTVCKGYIFAYHRLLHRIKKTQ
jgi:hypothetical protein